MGQIIIDKNADYSTQEVGVFDFENNIFRRKINGKLEKNKIKSTVNTAHTSQHIEIAENTGQFRFNFFENVNNGNGYFLGLADYVNNRAIIINMYLQHNSDCFIQFFVLSPSGTPNMVKTQQNRIDIGNLGILDPSIEHSLVVDVNFEDNIVTNGIFDGTPITLDPYGITTENLFTHKKSTLSFGAIPWINEIPIAKHTSEISFFQYKNTSGEILLHFDFLGDNETEILTDKAKLITLKNDGVQIVPVPI